MYSLAQKSIHTYPQSTKMKAKYSYLANKKNKSDVNQNRLISIFLQEISLKLSAENWSQKKISGANWFSKKNFW